MKKTPLTSQFSAAKNQKWIFWSQLFLCLGLLLAVPAKTHAANGVWTNTISGFWNDTNNWLNGVVASGSGSIADFSTIDLTANITVTADFNLTTGVPPTIGHMIFGDTDTNTLFTWTIADGGAGPITLDDTANPYSVITINTRGGTPQNLVGGTAPVTFTVALAGTNALAKAGAGRLILNPAAGNSYSGGTIISNGVVQIGPESTGGSATLNNNALNLGTGPITFMGGSLRQMNSYVPGNTGQNPSSGPTFNAMPNPINVPAGQVGTIYLSPRGFPCVSGVVTGSGTINIFADFVRDNLGGDWSGFTGQINAVPSTRAASEDLRFSLTTGFPLAKFNLTTNPPNSSTINFYNNGANGVVIPFGELSCTIPNLVNVSASTTAAGAGSALTFVMRVGGLNTDATFAGNFVASTTANNMGIIKEGTGRWTMTGVTIENNGMMVVNAGTLQIGSGTSGKLGRTAIVTNLATLAFGRSDTLAVTNVIDGTGELQQIGAGSLVLAPSSGANTYSGKTVVTAGLLAPVAEAALGANPVSFVSDQLTLNGGGLRSTNALSISGSGRGITLGAAGGKFSPDAGTTLSIQTPIAGSGSLTVNGAGTLALTGVNYYTGKTILSSGTLSLSDEAFLGANPASFTADQLTLNGGTLRATASATIDDSNRGISVGVSGGTLSADAGATLTILGPIAGSGTLTKSGAGSVVINAAGTLAGAVSVSQGTLTFGASGSLPNVTSYSAAAGAALDFTAAGLSLGNGQSISGNSTVAGNVTAGNGSSLTPAGAGVIGAIAISGNLTMNAGATYNADISTSTNDVVSVAGNIVLNGASTINVNALASLPVGTYSLVKVTGTISGSGSVTLAGYPVSRLTGNLVVNAHSIDLVIAGSAGSVVWQGGLAGNAWDVVTTKNWLNGGISDFFYNGDTVLFDNTGSANSTANLTVPLAAGSVTVNASANYTFAGSGKLTALTPVTKSGSGPLTVLTTNDYTGGTVISGGTVQVGNGTASGSLGNGAITDNASLVFNVPSTQSVPNAISGSGTLSVAAGAVTLSGNNSYGASSISGGATLQVGNGGTSGSLGTGAVSDNGALVFKRSDAVTNSGSISGGGSVSVVSGTAVLAADNSYTGTTMVDAGTLQVGSGGTSGSLGTAGFVTITNGGTLAFSRSDNLTNSIVITGVNGKLAQSGTGALVLTNDNSYGQTLVNSGALLVGNGVDPLGSLGSGAVTVSGSGRLVFNRPDAITNRLQISGSGGIAVYGLPTNEVNQLLSSVTISIPNGANTYSGGTTVSNSSLILLGTDTGTPAVAAVNSGALGSGTLTLLSNGVMQMERANVADVDGGATSGAFPNAINVPAGQTGTLLAPGRYDLNGTLNGAGTLNIRVNATRGNINGAWSNFFGTINVSSRAGGDFRAFNAAGFPNAKLHLGNTVNAVSMYWRGTANSVVPIGELSGDSLATLVANGGAEGGNAVTWRIGRLNTDAVFDGTMSGSVAFNVVKEGTGRWTLTGANTFTGGMTVSNGVLALATNLLGGGGSLGTGGGIDAAPTITLASPGTLDVSGTLDNTLHLGTLLLQTLRGNSTVNGNLVVDFQGTVSPGLALGTLTVTKDVTVNGIVNITVNRSAVGQTSSKLAAQTITLVPGVATLMITNAGPAVRSGDTFQIFSTTVVGGISNTFTTVTGGLPTVAGATWDVSQLGVNGTITAIVPVPTLTNSISADKKTFSFAWAPEFTGWTLQVQTNTLAVGISTNWFPVDNSSFVNQINFTTDPSVAGCLFFRLIAP